MDLASSMLEALSGTSKFKRLEQLKRWDDSDTNKESSILKDGPRKINFSDGCVFLAACSAGDKEEVKRLIEKGADIDTANIDGLTALHQACIDDNLEMVEFLVENGADVNRGDNEGWTPLHATASCGFISIAKYLIEHNSNVAAVNNDGELPIDIAESEEMEELLQDEINNQEIDCDAARNEEENLMIEDANRWLSSGIFRDQPHPKTGATALHVASAKGYIKVMNLLLQAGADINAQDIDGWTPLHGAAHWGQKEACEMLVEHSCDMDIKNVAGQTALDVADPDVVKLLEELRIKQSTNNSSQPLAILESNVQNSGKRHMRMSNTDKTQVSIRERTQEYNQNESLFLTDKAKRKRVKKSEFSIENSGSSENSESSDSEIEKRNKVNKSENFMDDHIEVVGNKEGKSDHLRIQETTKQIPKTFIGENEDDIPVWRRNIRKNENNSSSIDQLNEIIPRPGLGSRSSFPPNSNASNENDEEISRADRRRPISLESDERFSKFGMFVWQNRHNRPNSLPASMTTNTTTTTTTGSTAAIVVTTVTQISAVNSSPIFTRKSDELPNHPKIPSSDEHVDKSLTHVAVVTTLPSTTLSITTTTVTTTTATSPPTPSTPTFNQLRRSYAPPIRDEESETQRKAHAKRVRETRRSTQGVTLEEVKSAEQLIKKQQENNKETENHNSKGEMAKDRLQEIAKEQEKENALADLERRPSWRLRLEQDNKNKILEDVRPTRRTRESPIDIPSSTDSATSTTSSLSYVRRSRLPSTDNTDVGTPVFNTATGTVRTRNSRAEDDIIDKDRDSENSLTSSSGNSIQATQAAIHRRRRPKRRSTGVVYTEIDDGDGSQESLDHVSKVDEHGDDPDIQSSSDRGYRSRFGSSGSVSETNTRNEGSRFNDRTSQGFTQNDKEDKDYKKLYEELHTDHERLKEILSKKEKELQDCKQRCEKLQMLQKTTTSDAEKRERRALERKLSEYEEELKHLNKFKQENEKLKAENRALTRVVSKLTNK